MRDMGRREFFKMLAIGASMGALPKRAPPPQLVRMTYSEQNEAEVDEFRRQLQRQLRALGQQDKVMIMPSYIESIEFVRI